MKSKQLLPVLWVVALAVVLAACSGAEEEDPHAAMDHGEMESMDHSSSGELPDGLEKAENPAFKVGSKAVMKSDHMTGMNGAEATIAGAFDTTVYAVSYTPTSGGKKVSDHKWVIHEELRNAEDEPYQAGEKVVLEADHMNGMEGAEAIIDSAEQTTVYMVDFVSETDGQAVKNHKWVTESELSAK
ncbi:YdhK family protein [Planomicrobium chinense]|uniref:YdhK family protein n=1 Tax=Planococcus chinensis TaxID=272917 RepID=UPI001CC34A1F|nr:YdhK family protein [Planococcus chinensis]MBZ5202223.1 YdhK family protein [Planococcus chinensis]